MIRQSSAGIYSWLPLGFRVLKKIEQIVREEQDRSGAIEMLMPTIQPADLWRRASATTPTARRCCASRTGTSREMLYGPTNEELITADLPRRREVLSRPAAQPLPHPVEVPRRGAAPLRRDARARVPHEGRLFLRPERGGGAALPTTRCSSPTCAPSRAWGSSPSPWRPIPGPIGGDLSHEFIILAETGESRVFCHADLRRDAHARGRRRFRAGPDAAHRAVDPRTTRPPTRSTIRPASRPRCRRTSA